MESNIKDIISEHVNVATKVLDDAHLQNQIKQACDLLIKAFKGDKKVLLCGNGGSAADAQHIAAELSGRFMMNRPALFAEALHVNSSYMTAVSNDFGFDETYKRLVQGFGREGDILIALSTSGNSKNIIAAAQEALNRGIYVIGFSGESGGQLKDHCTLCLCVPSMSVPRIQEMHILIGHILCELVEAGLFSK
jgi:D-sedoheptulose 7-phosphate isomerase